MILEDIVIYVNGAIFVLFALIYAYQLFYIALSYKKPPKRISNKHNRKYAILIAARNEATVIGNLIDSIKGQTYDSELIDIFICADNCQDDTAKIAKEHGADYVYTRYDNQHIGKGYVLDYIVNKMKEQGIISEYDAIIVFDADNVVDAEFISEMDAAWDDERYVAMTSYRNSKNIESSWISAGYALWFMREARWLSQARANCGESCMISGTGFLVSMRLLEEQGGWIHHLLTEDIEFSIDQIASGRRIGYASKAIVYDEQPISFKDSWNQRMRWAKGFYQVLGKYWHRLVDRMLHNKSFAAYDALCTIAPAMLLTLMLIAMNASLIIIALFDSEKTGELLLLSIASLIGGVFNFCIMLAFFGIITSIAERDKIKGNMKQRIGYVIAFPLFMLTYIPIAVAALFSKVEWKPIAHTVAKSIDAIKSYEDNIKNYDDVKNTKPLAKIVKYDVTNEDNSMMRNTKIINKR